MGITPLMQGTTDDLDQTYRGTKMVITQGDQKHKQRAKSFRTGYVERLARNGIHYERPTT